MTEAKRTGSKVVPADLEHIMSLKPALVEIIQLMDEAEKKQQSLSKNESDLRELILDAIKGEGSSLQSLFEHLGDDISAWLENHLQNGEPSSSADKVLMVFARNKTKALNFITRRQALPVGKYRNPETGQIVYKIKRNPQCLEEWIANYPDANLHEWRIGDLPDAGLPPGEYRNPQSGVSATRTVRSSSNQTCEWVDANGLEKVKSWLVEVARTA